jgi:hypothetical protein
LGYGGCHTTYAELLSCGETIGKTRIYLLKQKRRGDVQSLADKSDIYMDQASRLGELNFRNEPTA